MCRSIKPLFNFDPPATDEEIHDAALQFVRKISGYAKPSQANEAVFNTAVDKISAATQQILTSLTTEAPHKNRETEAAKARTRNIRRFSEHSKSS